ncbi:hypothetical protein OF83DRAFT_1149209 [Amylostereum chailletii]|nr:hypothetical protein OF83DRAFT_1149209 [Amylostereum chailletii]
MRLLLPALLLSLLASAACAAPLRALTRRDTASTNATEWVDPDGTVHSTANGEQVPAGVWYFDYDETIQWLPGTPVDPEGRQGPLPDQCVASPSSSPVPTFPLPIVLSFSLRIPPSFPPHRRYLPTPRVPRTGTDPPIRSSAGARGRRGVDDDVVFRL